MGGTRFGTAVVLAALVLSCGTRQEPVSDNPGPDPEVAPPVEEPVANRIVTPLGAPTAEPVELESVPGFDDEEVQAYAAVTELAGDIQDANAEQWSTVGIAGSFDSIEGEWSGRWNFAPEDHRWETGTATVETDGNRVLIRYEDKYAYLIEAVRDGDRLVGRYVATSDLSITRPWIGLVVSNERIDGIWPTGRWDLRRGGASATEETSP